MPITCAVFGHKYSEDTTEERERVDNGRVVVERYKLESCDRCGNTNEEMMKSKIRQSEETEDSNDEDNENKEFESEEPSFSTGYTSGGSSIRSEKAQGGIILESNNENSTRESDTANDNGIITEKKSNATYQVYCTSCNYSLETSDPSQRQGDLCPECGSWLKMENIN